MNIQGKLSMAIYALTFFYASVSDTSDPTVSIVVLIMMVSAAVMAMWSGRMYKKEEYSISDEDLAMLEKLIQERKDELEKKDY